MKVKETGSKKDARAKMRAIEWNSKKEASIYMRMLRDKRSKGKK